MTATIELTKCDVTIQGLPPGLLFGSKGVMEADGDGKKPGKPRPPAEEAELRCHWTRGPKGKRELCIPWVNMYRSLCDASKDFKFKGQKRMSSVVPATISCELDRITLGTDKYEVVEEWVRIPPKTGAMVKIGRPLLKEWRASFSLLVDDEMYSAESLEEIIKHAGKMVGIGPWRPGLKGPYGKFALVNFKVRK